MFAFAGAVLLAEVKKQEVSPKPRVHHVLEAFKVLLVCKGLHPRAPASNALKANEKSSDKSGDKALDGRDE